MSGGARRAGRCPECGARAHLCCLSDWFKALAVGDERDDGAGGHHAVDNGHFPSCNAPDDDHAVGGEVGGQGRSHVEQGAAASSVILGLAVGPTRACATQIQLEHGVSEPQEMGGRNLDVGAVRGSAETVNKYDEGAVAR